MTGKLTVKLKIKIPKKVLKKLTYNMVLNSLANFRSLQIRKSAINQTKERDAHKSFAHHKITSNKSINYYIKRTLFT